MAKAVDKVRRKFTDRGKDTQFITRWLSAETVADATRAAGRYNRFKGEKTADAVSRIGEKDPNARFKFGREGSPVLYVETRKPRVAIGVLGNMSRRPQELDKVSADRITGVRSGHSVVRAWWN